MKNKVIIKTILLLFLYASCNEKPVEKPAAISKNASYQTAIALKTKLNTTLRLPAQLMAYQEVNIFPKVNGYVKNVLVDIGTHVFKGELLLRLEAPEMQQMSLAAKERFARSQADYNISNEHYKRLLAASKTAGAISPLELSATKAKMSADSSFANAEKMNWRMQETMGQYLAVKAPFEGIITDRNVNTGSLVSANSKDAAKPMLELKEIKRLRLLIDVPEFISGRLNVGDPINFMVTAIPGRQFTGKVSRKAMSINPQYRVEKTEIDIDNSAETLKPGMYADVILHLNGNNDAVVVPKSAVVTSTENKYVLIIKNNSIQKINVTTGNEDLNNIEVFGINAGDMVITKATDEIKEGVIK